MSEIHAPTRPLSVQMRHRLREGLFLIFVACAVFLLISLITYQTNDPGWSSTGLGNKVANWGGRVGAWISDIFLSLFGVVAYLFPFLIVLSSWLGLQEERQETPKKSREWVFKLIGWVIFITSSCGLVSFYFRSKPHLPADAGGIIGDLLGSGLSLLFNQTGSTLLFITLLLCGVTLVTGLSWLGLIDVVGEYAYQFWNYMLSQRKLLVVKPNPKAEPIIEKSKPVVKTEPVLAERTAPPPVITKPIPKVEKIEKVEIREKKKIEVDPVINRKLQHFGIN